MRYAPALAAPFLPPFLPPFVPPFLPFLPFLPFFLPVLPPFLPSPLLAPVLPFPSGAALANCVEAPPRIRPRDRTELSTHRNIVHLVTGVKKTRSAGLTEQCLSNTTPPARFRCLGKFSSLSTLLFRRVGDALEGRRARPPEGSTRDVASVLRCVLVQTQAGNSPATPAELRILQGIPVGERDDVAVAGVEDLLELLDRQVQETHDEAADGQAVRDDQDTIGFLAQHLTHQPFQKARGAVEAVGRALTARVAVIKPAMRLAHLLLLADVGVAVIHLAQAGVL